MKYDPAHAPSSIPARVLSPVGLGAALIGSEEEELVLDVIRRKELFRYYGMTPEAEPPMAATLERELGSFLNARHVLAVSNGTSALEVALGALGVGPGDEVILPAWSWDSCFTAIIRAGARPVLAEIDKTLCLAPSEIARLRTKRTKAVMVVHYQGVAAAMDAILHEAKKANLKVLEDCAESPGALYQGKRVGTLGDIGIFSFQYAKSMTSGEGGAVVTNDPLLYERAIRMHDLGKIRPYHQKEVTPSVPRFCGGQYRMTELQAAVALAQLRRLDRLRERCRRSREIITNQISDLDALEFRTIPDPSGDSGFELYFWLKTKEAARTFEQALKNRGIPTEKGTGTDCHYNIDYCLHGRPTTAAGRSPFPENEPWPAPGYRKEDFPMTEDLVHRFVAIPIGVLYTDEDADYIGRVIKEICRTQSG